MLKKLLVILIFSISLNVLYGEGFEFEGTHIPSYMQADFFHKYPYASSTEAYRYVKYKKVDPKILAHKPEKIRFQSEQGFEVINISQSANWTNAQTETWMAINPTNPQNLIATSNDNHYLSGRDGWRMSAFSTTDGGKNWKHSKTPSNEGLAFSTVGTGGTIFDPGIAFDSKGNAFYSYGFTQTGPDRAKNKNGVFIAKSTDGGRTWSDDWNDGAPIAPVVMALDDDNNPFHDRYSIAIDDQESSSYTDRIYVTWQRFQKDAGIVISVSDDGGKGWSAPQKLGEGQTQAPMPAVGPNGEVYVAWRSQDPQQPDIARAIVRRSDNGGNDFSPPIIAQDVYMAGTRNSNYGRWVLADKQDIRMSSPPQIAVDRSNEDTRGNVYIVQAGKDDKGRYGVYLAKSTDKGQNWEDRIRIDNNEARNDMFFPSISVDPKTGLIAVLYYSSQNDPENNQGVDAYVSVSDNGGESWNQIRVSPETIYLNSSNTVFTSGGGSGVSIYWGDYTSITAYDSKIYPLYWMPSHSQYYYGSNDLFTAKLSPAPQPITDLEFEHLIDDDVKVKLTWNNPGLNLYGVQLSDYQVVVNRDGETIAELPEGTTEYIDEDVVDGTTYNYSVQIKDNVGRLSAERFVSVPAGGNIKPERPIIVSSYPVQGGFELKFYTPDEAVDGTQFRDFQNIEVVYENGDPLETIDPGAVTLGDTSTVKVELETERFYEIKIKSTGTRGGVSDLSNKKIVYSGEPLTELNENFDISEEVIPIFTAGDWAITTDFYNSSPASLTDSPGGNYPNNTTDIESRAILAPITVQEGMTTLKFDHIAMIDNRNDKAAVNIFTLDDFEYRISKANWFDRDVSPKFNDTKENSEWDEMTIDLSEFTGETIFITFGIYANPIGSDDGWYIDNIEIGDIPVTVNDKIDRINMDVSVYPNPVKENANIKVKYFNQGSATVELFDLLGNKIETIANETVSPGTKDYSVDMGDLSVGSYLCKVTVNGKVKTFPIIVNR